MKEVKVIHEQSIFDCALMHNGGVEAAEWIVEDNESVKSLSGFLKPGSIIKVRDTIIDAEVCRKMQSVVPISDVSSSFGGIGYWAIGVDFVVS